MEVAIDVTFDEFDDSQKEQVNESIVGNEESPCEAIKKLAIGEVKPIEAQNQDEDDEDQPAMRLAARDCNLFNSMYLLFQMMMIW